MFSTTSLTSRFSVRFTRNLLLLFLVASAALSAQQPPADLDAYVARAMQTFQVPGMAVAIVKDGKVVLSKGYGVRSIGDPAPVDENTLFGIGSNTKAFTAAAIATLVDSGKLNWDDPVYQRLPGFQMYDPYVSHEMRIRDLLCHRSGLGLGEGDLLIWPHSDFTRDDIVYKVRFLKPYTSFRSTYAYSNLMFIVAGQVVAHNSGKSWDDYLREQIFLPLGMTHTNTTPNDFRPGANWASPHALIDGKLQIVPRTNLDNAAAAGAINSSVADMSRWLLLQLNRGAIPSSSNRVFSEKSSYEMWSEQTPTPIHSSHEQLRPLVPNLSGYGLGWALRDYKGRKLIGHNGGLAGYVSRVLLVPQENLGIVILTNAEQDLAYESVLYHILDSYLGGESRDYLPIFKQLDDQSKKKADESVSKAETSRASNIGPSLPLEKYAGSYSDPWFGSVSLRLESGRLILHLPHSPQATAELQHWQYDTFKTKWNDPHADEAFVTFALKPDGSIDHFTMAAVSPLADFSSDYQDLYFTPLPGEGKN